MRVIVKRRQSSIGYNTTVLSKGGDMKRIVLLTALAVALSGCGETTEVNVTITKLVQEDRER